MRITAVSSSITVSEVIPHTIGEDMIHTVIIGRLGKDPEKREVNGKPVLRLTVAADHGWGEKKTTSWVAVDVWGRADALAGLLGKGSQVGIRGELWLREYEGKSGRAYSLDCRADEVEVLTPKKDAPTVQRSGDDDPIPF
jgi:single-strand DNA-binding protein